MPSPIPRTAPADEHPLLKSFRDKLSKKSCRFMVFGPNPAFAPATSLRDALRNKRIQIRGYITNQLGCQADFPEDLFVNAMTDIPIFSNNMVRLELEAARRDYDLVIILVESPGSCVELGYFCGDIEVREKTAAFILESHRGGLASITAQADARYCHFYVESDLTVCHLLTKVSDLVARVQQVKLIAPL